MRENYINIQSFMIKELKLKWNELILYALIYWFSQDWRSKFRWSLNYIEEWLQVDRKTVLLNLSKLTNKWLISKVDNPTGNLYSVIISSGETPPVEKLPEGSGETPLVSSGETPPNNNKYNNKNNNNILADEVFSLYFSKLPKEKKKYNKSSQAKLYIEQLLKEYSADELKLSILNYYKKTEAQYIMATQYFFSNTKQGKTYRPFTDYLWNLWSNSSLPRKEINLDDLIL